MTVIHPMIEVEGLHKFFGEGDNRVEILKGIDLVVEKGDCLVLKGISGSGKTTLLSIIAGLDKPSRGKLLVAGEPISKLPDLHISHFRAQKIGMIFQHFNLLESLTSAQNIMVPLIPTGISMKDIRARVRSSMALANISHKADSITGRLSGGEKQRVAIARALAADPDIIVCDEPTANLDRDNSLKFIEILTELHGLGKTILIATHDPLFDALPFANTIKPMEDGRIKEFVVDSSSSDAHLSGSQS